MLSNTPRLNFSYLKIINILHTRYQPKIMGYILKKQVKEQVCLCSWDFPENQENEDENEKIIT